MARITIDEREWHRINKTVRQHEEYIEKLKQQNYSHSTDVMGTGNLSIRENDIFRYISENPNCNKADVERYFKGKIARQTLFNTIDNLVEDGLVKDGINEMNRQTRSLVINNDSEISLLIQKLNQFEKTYLSLIDKVKDGFQDSATKIRHSLFQKYEAFEVILSIYDDVIKTYLMQAIYAWPKKISDNESLSKLYTILFTKLSQTQLELAKRSRIIFEDYDLIENMVFNSSIIPSTSKYVLFQSSKEFHYEKELENVLHIANSIGSEVASVALKSSRGGKIRILGCGNKAISQKVRSEKGKDILVKPHGNTSPK